MRLSPAWILVAWLALAGLPAAGQTGPRIVLAGPPAAVSFPLLVMIERDALAGHAEAVEFVEWRDPDRVRALVLRGEADFVALPSNVAANLHNRGAEVRLLNVSTWGLLWILSRDPELASLADLQGRELAVPFRGDMPDIVLHTLLRAGESSARPRIRYVASPMQAVQMLLLRRLDHALLSEPAASMALYRARHGATGMLAPDLYRAIDVQREWGQVLARDARIPQAGIAVLGQPDPALIEAFAAGYRDALDWIVAEPEVAAEVIAGRLDMLTPGAVADAIAHSRLELVPAPAARAALEHFYRLLAEQAPALIGGQLPPDAFYHDPDDGG